MSDVMGTLNTLLHRMHTAGVTTAEYVVAAHPDTLHDLAMELHARGQYVWWSRSLESVDTDFGPVSPVVDSTVPAGAFRALFFAADYRPDLATEEPV